MSKEIINRVEKSKLISIDLEEYYPYGDRYEIDLKDWLFNGLYLKEKPFRESIKNHNWTQYKDAFVAISCTSQAIIPPWAYMLISSKLSNHAKKTVIGNLNDLEVKLFEEKMQKIDLSIYQDKSIVIKGCSNNKIPVSIYYNICAKLLPIAKSIMYGEACASVPIFKKTPS
ncbi:MAG TPA: DUF2480 family protein [Flavobacteriaceae bacterium]|nr:DUF2480 family protein [Flavobacteriaceae bacterium]